MFFRKYQFDILVWWGIQLGRFLYWKCYWLAAIIQISFGNVVMFCGPLNGLSSVAACFQIYGRKRPEPQICVIFHVW